MPRFAERTRRIAASATVAMNNLVAQKRAKGIDMVSFNIGEPDFDTPQHVKEAAIAALRAGRTKYTPGAGIPELRAAIADAERKDNGIPCTARHVVVTPAKHGIFLSLQATTQQGDEVLLPDPAWVSYEPIVQWAHATPVPVPILADDGFRMRPEAVAERITRKTKAIILNSPSNPTGGVNTPEDVRGIVELAIDHDLWVISDEIYQKLLYDGRHVSAAALPGGWERTFTVNGLSKSFAMTGWRTGWVVAPDAAVAEVDKLQSQSLTHITSFAQDGALAAVAGPQDSVAAMRDEYRRRRDLMVAGLNALPGVSCPTPAGAFYCFARFDPRQWGGLLDDALAMGMLERADVAVTPGLAFGARGASHVRLSYATHPDRIREGLRRLGAWQKELRSVG
ncbi:MAG: aspartate aminotransferase [Thermoplasmata archaeon]|nr:aspartate aminotransferase [Thermoplasmata archaeon]